MSAFHVAFVSPHVEGKTPRWSADASGISYTVRAVDLVAQVCTYQSSCFAMHASHAFRGLLRLIQYGYMDPRCTDNGSGLHFVLPAMPAKTFCRSHIRIVHGITALGEVVMGYPLLRRRRCKEAHARKVPVNYGILDNTSGLGLAIWGLSSTCCDFGHEAQICYSEFAICSWRPLWQTRNCPARHTIAATTQA